MPDDNIEELIQEMNEELIFPEDVIRDKFNRRYIAEHELEIPAEYVKNKILSKWENVRGYDPIETWDGDLPPPHINEFLNVPSKNNVTRISHKGKYDIYCLECELIGSSIKEVKEKSKEELGESKNWIDDAYNADHVLYIGYTKSLRQRLKQHRENSIEDEFSPSHLTVISKIKSFGVALYHDNKEQAEKIEEKYSYDIRQNTPDHTDVFVYQR